MNISKNIKILLIIYLLSFLVLLCVSVYKLSVYEQTENRGSNYSSDHFFGAGVKGDIDGQGIEDAVYLITEEPGGSGTFYYVTAILNGQDPLPKVFLGDRIAPQNTSIENGIISVNYADRKPEDSFTVAPSVGKTLRLKFDKTKRALVLADNNLSSHPWKWQGAKDKTRFVLTFKDDNSFSASTDCNGVGGEYLSVGTRIAFDKMMSTLMYCEGSQEAEFTKILSEAKTYLITPDGELIIISDKGAKASFR